MSSDFNYILIPMKCPRKTIFQRTVPLNLSPYRVSIMNLTWAKKGQTVFSLWWLCLLPFHPLTADLEAKAGEQKNDQNADQNASNNKCGITGFSPNAKFNFPLECFKIAAINFQCCITNVGPIINPLIKSSEVFSQTILKGLGQITLDSSEKLKILLQGVS